MAKTPKVSYRVQSQYVTIHNPVGGRIRQALKSKWRTWKQYREMGKNIEDAITNVVGKMLKDHVGGIVVIRQVIGGVSKSGYTKIFQAKWGTDGEPFARFDGVAGDYWMRKIDPRIVKRLEKI